MLSLALKSCPKCNKSPNLVTLVTSKDSICKFFITGRMDTVLINFAILLSADQEKVRAFVLIRQKVNKKTRA